MSTRSGQASFFFLYPVRSVFPSWIKLLLQGWMHIATFRLSCQCLVFDFFKHFEVQLEVHPSISIISMYGNVPLRCVVSVKITQLTLHLDVETSDTSFWFQEAYLESNVRWLRHLWPLNLPKQSLGPGLSHSHLIISYHILVPRRWCQVRPLKLPKKRHGPG